MILTISKNNVPLVSENPFLNPACENGWQGNPQHRISKSGISFAFIFVISQAKFHSSNKLLDIFLKLCSYVFLASLSHSDANTQSHPRL